MNKDEISNTFFIFDYFFISISKFLWNFKYYIKLNKPITKIDIFDKDTQVTIDITTLLVPILTIGLAIITLFLTPMINEKFKLREQYIVPYRKWCTTLYGGLQEYKTLLCHWIDDRENCNKKHITPLSDEYIIIHFWELHDHISTGHMWLGKIHKEICLKNNIDDGYSYINSKEDIDKAFKLFIDHTDKCWHRLEDTYKEFIGRSDQKDFTEALRNATTYYNNKNLLSKMVQTIRNDLVNYENPLIKDDENNKQDNQYNFKEELFQDMLKFLEKQIP